MGDRRAWFALTVMLAALGCGIPSRRLPTRAVADPLTLPRRMMEATVGATGTLRNENRERSAEPLLGLRYGVTDRLTWTGGLLAFEYALLDDAPVEHAATGGRAAGAPLGLSVTAGLAGFAYSSVDGVYFYPILGVSAVKHLGDRFAVDGAGQLVVTLSQYRPEAWTYLQLGGRFQLADRTVLKLSLSHNSIARGTSRYRWQQHIVGATFGPEFRAAHWVDLGVGLRLEARLGQPRFQLPPVPPSEPAPLPLPPPPPHRFPIGWASAWATFHW